MNLRRIRNGWAVWAFALALLLKAAVPMLATASAQMQGKALAEVCTVYGVATIGALGSELPDSHEGATAHAGDHCTLSALFAVSPGEPQTLALFPFAFRNSAASPYPVECPPDACAAWAARRKHEPPSFA